MRTADWGRGFWDWDWGLGIGNLDWGLGLGVGLESGTGGKGWELLIMVWGLFVD